MSYRSSAQRTQALKLIAEVDSLPFWHQEPARHMILKASSMALAGGDRLIEAQALLRLMRSWASLMQPHDAWTRLRRAREIFATNGFAREAAQCWASSMLVLSGLGHERAAIGVARDVLSQGALDAEGRFHVHLLRGVFHARLGDFGAALAALTEDAAPLVASLGVPQLRARYAVARGVLGMRALARSRWPELQQPLLDEARRPHSLPGLDEVLACFDEATALQPAGISWPYIELFRQQTLGLLGSDPQASRRLVELAQATVSVDPPCSVMALLAAGSQWRVRRQWAQALQYLESALSMARSTQHDGLERDTLQQVAAVHEAAGNAADALRFMKLFAQSLGRRRDPMGLVSAHTAAIEPPSTDPMAEQRDAKPARMRLALQFLDARAHMGVGVAQVAGHCGVSRRTLELDFREHMGQSVAEYTRKLRLNRAAKELLLTQASVKAVALSAGYRSPSSFAREFRSSYGLQPTEWRRQNARSGGE